MLYLAYQAHADIIEPAKSMARPVAGRARRRGAALPNVPVVAQSVRRVRADRARGLTHARPAYGIDTVTVGNQEVEVSEVPTLTLPFGTLLHFKKDVERRAAARAASSRRCRATSPRCCAKPCARCCPTTTSTSPTGTTPATSAWTHGRFGFDDYVDYIIQLPRGARPRRAPGRRLPALRAGAGRRRGDGRATAIPRSRAA